MSLNRVMVSGNLTRDPELRQTAGGMSVLGFGIAVNDRRKNSQTGEWEDYPNFLDCTVFGARADGLAKYLTKGSKVAIDGKLRWSQWERDGQKRSKVEIIVDSLDFMSRNSGSSMPVAVNNAPTDDSFGSVPMTDMAPQNDMSAMNAQNPGLDSATYGEDIPF